MLVETLAIDVAELDVESREQTRVLLVAGGLLLAAETLLSNRLSGTRGPSHVS